MLQEWDKLIADTQAQLERCPCKPWRVYLTNRIETLKAKKAEYEQQLEGI
jgi:hypothetical protein